MTSHAVQTAAMIADKPVAARNAPRRSFRSMAGGGALIGALAGVAVAVPLAAPHGLIVFIATAIDVAAGLALIGGLIGANVAGTD